LVECHLPVGGEGEGQDAGLRGGEGGDAEEEDWGVGRKIVVGEREEMVMIDLG
jgi:hypothetical protein